MEMIGKFKPQWILFVVFIILALPPVRHFLEQSMVTHMLIQLPALVIIGWLATKFFPISWKEKIMEWNRWGISGMAFAIVIMLYWMLPRTLDAALSEWTIELVKFSTLPLMGMALGLSWPLLNSIAQGVLKLEFWATFMRMGWLYLDLPDRLCSNYLLGDQRILGQLLLIAGTIWAFTWMLRIVFGVSLIKT